MQLRNVLLATTLLAGCVTEPADGVTTQAVTYNGIDYHGGVLLGKPNVYLIWYGNWSGNTATQILPDLVSHLGGTRYWGIEQTYANGAGNRVSNAVNLAGQVSVGYPLGANLPQGAVGTLITSLLETRSINLDDDGIYLVLGSPDVTESSGSESFCHDYFGYHAHFPYRAALDPLTVHNIKFGFIGDVEAQCPGWEVYPSPNRNPGADTMASTIAHELAETATDPLDGGWWKNPGPADGNENGDLCEMLPEVPITIAGRGYMLPPIWINAFGGKCSTGVARVSITTPYDSAYVTSTMSGLSCASNCTSFFEAIGTYTLTAHVEAGATFTGWSGCDAVSGTTCTISTLKDHDVKPLVCNRPQFLACMDDCIGPLSVCATQCQSEWGC